MMDHPLISADSHVYERSDVWTDRIDKRFRDALKVELNENGDELMTVGDYTLPVFSTMLKRLGLGHRGSNMKRMSTWSDDDVERMASGGWNAASGMCFDPAQRLKDQDADGVSAEVIYPSYGGFFHFLDDFELQAACHRAYNDWLAEFCAHDTRRLNGVAMLSIHDVAGAAKELERAKSLGLKGGLLPCSPPPGDPPYSSADYDDLWRTASELDMPLSMHIATDPRRDKRPQQNLTTYMALVHDEIAWSIGEIVVGGALERHDDLKIIAVETDVSWMPPYVRRLDRYHRKYASPTPSLPPSAYFARVFATFVDEPIGNAWQSFGTDNYMWGGDFPHSDSTWPNSRRVLERDFIGVPDGVQRKNALDNAAQLYGIHID